MPRDNRLILFGAWFGKKYDDNPKYLFEYILQNHKEIKAYWLTSDRTVFKQLNDAGLPVVLSSTIKARYLALRAKYFVLCTWLNGADGGTELMKYYGNVVFINLWHGVPLKKIMYDDNYHYNQKLPILDRIDIALKKYPYRKTYHISTSETFEEIYQSCFRTDAKHILNLGQPRNDYFYSGNKNPLKELFPGKNIVLYMPTHRREGQMRMDMESLLDLSKINAICQMNNSIFIIKKHFYHKDEPAIAADFQNIVEIRTQKYKSQELLDAADILITDYSSCFIDHLLKDKPQIFYAYDIEDYLKNDRDMYFNYEEIAPGQICKTKEELEVVLEQVLCGKDTYFQKREKMKDFFYSKKNQRIVSPQIVEKILSLN